MMPSLITKENRDYIHKHGLSTKLSREARISHRACRRDVNNRLKELKVDANCGMELEKFNNSPKTAHMVWAWM